VREPVFLTVDDVLWIHERQLELFGGQAGLRDPGLLDSAVGMASQTFDGAFLHADLCEQAAAYAFHIAENQPFLDGNKRTALESCLDFLDLNGVVVDDPDGKLYDAMIGLATRAVSKHDFADLLRRLARESSGPPPASNR
jgi:death-on-curing protein